MEKMAVIRPDITPELTTENGIKAAGVDCVKTDIVDNCRVKTVALDADFRKAAAIKVAKTLDSK